MAKKTDKGGARRNSGRAVRPEESELFRSAVGDARPLDRHGEPIEAPPPDGARTPRVARVTAAAPPPVFPKLPELRPGAADGVDARSMERLRKGRMRPEARLDLHGKTQAEAYAALTDFIAASRDRGRRCVIVITGKGRISEGGGVLRNQVPRWLNQAGCRPHILGFSEAQPKDGGAGALYVLLRRKR